MFSIRRFLLGSLLLVILAGGFLLAVFTYRTTYHELDKQYDAELVQSAHLLAGFWQEGYPPDASLAALDANETRYLRYFVYQLWRDGELVAASGNIPSTPLIPLLPTPHYQETNGWHGYSLPLSGERWLILAESDRTRRSMVQNLAASVLAPYLVSVPFIIALVWLSIHWGLSPLVVLAKSLSQRSPDNLAPLDGKPVRELEPVKKALNHLLARLEVGIEREKRFTADAAHELRTLLMVLRLHAENARNIKDESQREASLLRLEDAVDRAERMLEQLLVLARLDPSLGPPKEGSGADVLTAARETVASLVPLGDRFHQQLEVGLSSPVWVAIPHEALQLVLRNLIDNACRYTPAGIITINAALEGDNVRVEVADSGEGLSHSQQQRYSERFSRGGSGKGEGAGLGLSIVGAILALYGGSLEYRQYQVGCPAAAIVTLPASDAKGTL